MLCGPYLPSTVNRMIVPKAMAFSFLVMASLFETGEAAKWEKNKPFSGLSSVKNEVMLEGKISHISCARCAGAASNTRHCVGIFSAILI